MKVNKFELKRLLESHFDKDLVQDKYELKDIDAKNLLTNTRFDLAFKVLYLEMIDRDVKFAKEIYTEHIRAFSLGKFTEPGNADKNSLDRFIEDFHNIFEDIKCNGFDSSKTVIPLSKNGSIANGAHRVASAIYLNKKLKCVNINTADHIYDYKFFYSRNVPDEALDIAATKFVEYADNIHVAFVWPTAQGYDKEIEEIIPNIVYRKEIKLTPNGAHNLLSQIYYGEKWLGSVENDFKGSQGKLLECFKSFEPVRVIAFQADSLDEVLRIKDKIRDVFNVGKHSIHITDTKEEAIRVVNMVFNNNSIHFLNNAKPNKYLDTHTNLTKFKDFMVQNKLNVENIVLNNSVILSVYGLRESGDIDYFVDDKKELKYNNDELEYYNNKKLELIYNPKNYFYFNDLKFISFTQLYKMKKNRAEEQDKSDCKMMEVLMENKGFKTFINKWKQSLYYGKIKIKAILIKFLTDIRLYELTKKIYKAIKK
ncbi:hypothetical protein [Sulfurimonas marina]|uniref:Uncharacterized protein n=1 Tax=Sulfurimonas marina TaxID=2590551 RepID=A0A7M1AVJ0_9BACT|nr:hypothetical protein [Sulfurimonas marina]QOP41459.1 hypothetical protein FJR03_06755 [Sulfurimonas marina]